MSLEQDQHINQRRYLYLLSRQHLVSLYRSTHIAMSCLILHCEYSLFHSLVLYILYKYNSACANVFVIFYIHDSKSNAMLCYVTIPHAGNLLMIWSRSPSAARELVNDLVQITECSTGDWLMIWSRSPSAARELVNDLVQITECSTGTG